MKLSIEAKVAAAVATGFVALTVGAIGQGNSASQTGGPNGYGPTSNAGANTHMNQQGTASSGIHLKNVRSRKHHMQRVRENQRTHLNEPGD